MSWFTWLCSGLKMSPAGLLMKLVKPKRGSRQMCLHLDAGKATDRACEDAPSIPRTMRCRFSGHGSNLATMSARCSLVRPRICRKEAAAAAEVSPIYPTAENPSHCLTEMRFCVISVSQRPACPQGTPLDSLWSADLSYPAASTKRNYIHALKKIKKI